MQKGIYKHVLTRSRRLCGAFGGSERSHLWICY